MNLTQSSNLLSDKMKIQRVYNIRDLRSWLISGKQKEKNLLINISYKSEN